MLSTHSPKSHDRSHGCGDHEYKTPNNMVICIIGTCPFLTKVQYMEPQRQILGVGCLMNSELDPLNRCRQNGEQINHHTSRTSMQEQKQERKDLLRLHMIN